MLPVLSVFANAIAVFGGWFVSTTSIGVSTHTYVASLKQFFFMKDLFSGLLKSVFFGGIIGTMGCYYGFVTEAAPRASAWRPPERSCPRACWC